jgi:UDP-3-O-[3-hydroxymyristoyl] glucosamine N-acyltransferase
VAGVSLGQIAARFGLVLRGDPEVIVDRVATLHGASAGALSFLANAKYRQALERTQATAVVLEGAAADACPSAVLISRNPYADYARIAGWLHPSPPRVAGVHPSAIIDPTAQVPDSAQIGPQVVLGAGVMIGERVRIGAGSFLEAGVSIGHDSVLAPRVTVYPGVRIGARCMLHSGCVLGADGFGIAKDGEAWIKVPQLGTVVVGDDVEIGANTTIDRGAIEDTVIEDDVRLDNQIQIGHNVRIGAHTAIAACVGVSGSTTIGRHCMIAGAVGIAGHLEIADHVVVLGLSMVSRSLTKAGVYASGMPVSDAAEWRRIVARLRHIDGLTDRVRALEGVVATAQADNT